VPSSWGNSTDVRFDYDGALRLARSLWAYADELEAAKAERKTEAEHALRTWKGPYATEFVGRGNDEQTSISALIAALRSDADAWAQAWKNAMDEQNRRLYARRVARMKEERSVAAKIGDWLTGFEAPPPPAPLPKPGPAGFYPTGCLTG
jgi:class 3 adenylate cyclase